MMLARPSSTDKYAHKERAQSQGIIAEATVLVREFSATEVSVNHQRILQVLFLTFFPPPPPFVTPGSALFLSSTATAVLIANSNTWSTPLDSLALHSI